MLKFLKHNYTHKITDYKKERVRTSFLSKILNHKRTGDFIFIEKGPEINVQNIEYSKKLRGKKQKDNRTLFSNDKKANKRIGVPLYKKRKLDKIGIKILYRKIKKMNFLKKKHQNVFKNYRDQIIKIREESKVIIMERQSRAIKIFFILSNIFEKNVIIEKAYVNRKSGTARILAKAIAHLCLNKKYARVKKIVKKSVRIFQFTRNPNKIVGIKVTINGRLKIGRITPRKTKRTFMGGRLKNCSSVSVARVVSKNYKGQYSITVKLAII